MIAGLKQGTTVSEAKKLSEYDASKMDYIGPETEDILGFDPEKGKELKTHRSIVDILSAKYAQEMDMDSANGDDPTEESDLDVETGAEPDEIDNILDDLEDYITNGEKGASEEGFITNESVEDAVIARLLREMEEVENEIKQDEDEKSPQAGTDAFKKGGDALEKFLEDAQDGVEGDFAESNHAAEEDKLNHASDKPLDVQEALDLLKDDLDMLDGYKLLEALLFEDEKEEDDKAEDKEEGKEEANEETPEKKEGDKKDENQESNEDELNVDKKVSEGIPSPLIRNKKNQEELLEAFKMFKEELEKELEDLKNSKKVDGDEDDKKEDAKKDEEKCDDKVSDKEVEAKMKSSEPVKEEQENPNTNEIETGEAPKNIDQIKKDLEDELLEMIMCMEDIDEIDVPEEKMKDDEKTDKDEDEDEDNKKKKDEDEAVQEGLEDFNFDDDLDYLSENEDLLDEILNSI